MNHLDKEQNIVENLVLSEMIIYPWTLVTSVVELDF